MTKHEVKIDAETLDRLAVAGLREWRETILKTAAKHAEDRAADKMRIAAIDVLLAYTGETP